MKTKKLFLLLFTSFLCKLSTSLKCSNDQDVNKTLNDYESESSMLFSQYAFLTKNENVRENLETEALIKGKLITIDDILPTNQSLYLKRRPPTICGHPAKVTYHITVLSLDSINEASMTYSLDVYLNVAWIDNRLRFPENSVRDYLILDPKWLGEIWQPDTVFKNAREVVFHEGLVPNHYLWMLRNNNFTTLIYVSKLTLSLSCAMDFSFYPHDTQECDLKIESMTYTTKELIFRWDKERPVSFKTRDGKIVTPQFRSVHNKTENCTVPYTTGTYTCIRAIFYLRRSLSYHIIHTYFPSGLIVVLSWITFWIKIKDIMPRIALGVTTLLTMATLTNQSQGSLPPVSYGKAIDVWMTCCVLFVFCSIIEFAIVNYLVCQFSDEENISIEPEVQKTSIMYRLKAHFSHKRVKIIAHNIDRMSRFVFPVCFVVLNIWYWGKYLQEDEINGEKISDTEI